MKVGDLVTLSAAGKKVQDVEHRHRTFFKGPHSSYWSLCPDDHKRFKSYWNNNKMVGLVTEVRKGAGRVRWNQEERRYETGTSYTFYIAWQANPKPMATTRHSRSHLKFVSRKKGK